MKQHSGNILIVDDEPHVGRLIREVLSEHGFVCRVVQEAGYARSLINSQPPDVLITDIQMPQVSGLELLACAKKRAPHCKVILVTGRSKRQYVAQALLLGAYDYIEKPFRRGELVEIVSKAVSGGADSSILSDRAAAALELSAEARQASLDSVRALVLAVEAKDPYTRRHSEQVAHYAVNLAAYLGLPEATVQSIRVPSLLHDIGKIGVPDHILTKLGPLTDEEFEYIRRHPALGSDILASITLFGEEAQLVRHHHERWDTPTACPARKHRLPRGSSRFRIASTRC